MACLQNSHSRVLSPASILSGTLKFPLAAPLYVQNVCRMTKMLAGWWDRACLPAPPRDWQGNVVLGHLCTVFPAPGCRSQSVWAQRASEKILRSSSQPTHWIKLSLYFALSLIWLYSFHVLHQPCLRIHVPTACETDNSW